MAKMHAAYDNYRFAVGDVRDEVVKRIEKYEKESFEDTEYCHGFVDGVDAAIKWIDDFMDRRTAEYETEEPGSPFGPSIDW